MRKILDNLKQNWITYGFETLVVIVGILIAYGLNNWNEGRKIKLAETEYLKRLSEDLRKDQMILIDRIKVSEKLSSDYLKYIEKIYETQESLAEYKELIRSVEFNVDELYLTDIAFSELVNSGKLNLISNTEIKDRLINYYRKYEFVASRIHELNESNLFVINKNDEKNSLKYYLDIDQFADKDYMFDIEDLKFLNEPRSGEFKRHENVVYYYYLKQEIVRPMFQELKTWAIELNNQIDEELVRKK